MSALLSQQSLAAALLAPPPRPHSPHPARVGAALPPLPSRSQGQPLRPRPRCWPPVPLQRQRLSAPRSTVLAQVAAAPKMERGAVDFKKLQNGSDIRGVALEGVPGEAVNLTPEVAVAIGAGFAVFLAEKLGCEANTLRVSVGHDSRVSAFSLMVSLSMGLASQGVDVIQYGLASTPAMFNSTVTEEPALQCPADGGVMITASHLPFNRNGFKFFTEQGGAAKADISKILAHAATFYGQLESLPGPTSMPVQVDYMKRYCADLVIAVRDGAGGAERPLEGFHIVVDAGNGAGGFFAGGVLEPLGATTSGSQFLEPNGLFPNHIPNPEDKAAMAAITRAVLENKADMGIIFDTDVDRAAAVDSAGLELNRNRLIALLAAIVTEEHPGTTIVTDSVTSDGLANFIEGKLGARHHRFKRGYKNVIDEGIRLNTVGEECHLAIETSGHGALKENRWLDDGAYLMVKLLIRMARAAANGEGKGSVVLTRLIEELKEAEEAAEVRFKINQEHPDIGAGGFKEYGQKVIDALEAEVAQSAELEKAPVNHEGVRVSGYGGWFLLRLSLHDPVLPLNMEGPTPEAMHKLGTFVKGIAERFPALDISALDKYLAKSVN